MSPIGHLTTLESFLNRYFPDLKILRSNDGSYLDVLYSECPMIAKSEIAIDEAWERNQ